jgi:PAS domain S-box-containing protein
MTPPVSTDGRPPELPVRDVLDSLFAFVGLLSPDGVLVEANRAALEAAGLGHGDVLGRPFWDAHWWSWSEHEQERLREAVQRAAAGETVRYDAEVRLLGDHRIWIDFQLFPLRDGTGAVTGLVPSGIDVTDRRRAEDTLTAIIEHAPLGFGQFDTDLRFVRINEELAAMNGLPPADHIGRTPMSLFPDLPTDAYLPAFAAALDGRAAEFELAGSTHAEPGEQRWWLERVYPLIDREGRITGVGVFVLDITDRHRAAQERERNLHDLQTALLPRRLPPVPGLTVATRYRTADEALEVGGDFYEVLTGDAFGCAALIGDVCGRGLAATALTALSRYTLVPVIEAHPGSPAAALTELNRILLDHHDPSTRFVTIALAYLRPDGAGGFAGRLALAGHPPPVLVRAGGDTEEVGAFGSLLGIERDVRILDVPVVLGPGDALVMFTDGYTEARSPEGLMFGEARLRAALAAASGRDGETVLRVLDEAIAAFTGTRGQSDDRASLALSPDAARA